MVTSEGKCGVVGGGEDLRDFQSIGVNWCSKSATCGARQPSFIFYLSLAALGLRCCLRAFSSCGERGLLFIAVRRLLIAVASLVAEHGL